MTEIEVPEGWEWTILENIAEITGGNPAPQGEIFFENGIHPFVRVQDLGRIGSEIFISKTKDKMNEKGITKMKLFPKGSVLFTKSGMSLLLNQRAILPKDMHVVSHIGIAQPKQAVTSKFLYYWLKTIDFKNYSNVTSLPSVRLSDLKKIPFLLPPKNTQKIIVQRLENILNQLNEKKKSIILLQNVKQIEKLNLMWKQSILSESFSGNLTYEWRKKNSNDALIVNIDEVNKRRTHEYEKICEDAIKLGKKKPRRPENLIIVPLNNDFFPKIPDSWLTVTLTDIASIRHYAMSSGPFGSALGNKDYLNEGVVVVRGQNIQNGEFVLKKLVYVSKTKATELKRSSIYPDDLVSVAVGYSGSSAIVPKELKFAIISQNCNKITLDNSLTFSKYVNYFLQMEGSKNSMKSKTTDTARPFLSLTNLKKIMIPLPPISEQKQIIQILDKKFTGLRIFEKKTLDLKNGKNKTLDYIDHIYFKILQSAFSGSFLD